MSFLRAWQTRRSQPMTPLSVLFFPQGFLTAVLQRHARKHQVPINKLELSATVASDDAVIAAAEAEVALKGRSGRGGGRRGQGPALEGAGKRKGQRKGEVEEEEEEEEEGVLVTGLWLEGARWDRDGACIRGARPGMLHDPLPPVHLLPKDTGSSADAGRDAGGDGMLRRASSFASAGGDEPLSATSEEAGGGVYVCPVFKTSERFGELSTTGISTNFVMALSLPCEGSASRWTLAGVAAVCGTSE